MRDDSTHKQQSQFAHFADWLFLYVFLSCEEGGLFNIFFVFLTHTNRENKKRRFLCLSTKNNCFTP